LMQRQIRKPGSLLYLVPVLKNQLNKLASRGYIIRISSFGSMQSEVRSPRELILYGYMAISVIYREPRHRAWPLCRLFEQLLLDTHYWVTAFVNRVENLSSAQ
jgi:predicted phosphatase